MSPKYKYKAFISYSHQDKKWGDWLHKKLESYRIPKGLIGKKTKVGEVGKRLFPIFRDREELPTSNELGLAIKTALDESSHLIVVCSPNSANSTWVNEEIKYFKSLGRSDNILSFIVDGKPNVSTKSPYKDQECFPEALKYQVDSDGNLTSQMTEPIAADSRKDKDGKGNAFIKLVAGLVGVGFDELKQRDQARKQKKLLGLSILSLILVTVMTALTLRAMNQQIEAERQRAKAMTAQKVAEQARENESVQRKKAVLAQRKAVQVQRNAEWTAYVNQINLADSKIKQGDIVTAENILWRTNPKFRNWEWGRLILNADCSLLTVNLHEKNSYFHSGHVEKASFTHDGKKFLAVGTGGQIKIWDTNSGKLFRKFNSRNEIIRWIDITSDSSKFISSTEEGPVRIWDIQSGKELMQIKNESEKKSKIIDISFFKKGNQIAIGTNEGVVTLYDIEDGTPQYQYQFDDNRLFSFDFSPNETKMVTSHNNGIIQITDFSKGHRQYFPIHSEKANVVYSKYAPKGGTIFTADSARNSIFWNPISKEVELQTRGQFNNCISASFSPNGNFLATACVDGTVQVWDNWKKGLVSNIRAHPLSLTAVDFHPDNKRFLTASHDGKVRIWDRQVDENIILLELRPSSREVSISPDNSKALVISKNGKELSIFNTHSSQKLFSISQESSKAIRFSTFSPCGEKILTVYDDSTFSLRSLKTRKNLFSFEGHSDRINFASFSPDGKLIATTSNDKSAKVWETETAKLLASLEHNESVILASFDCDGKNLVTCSENQNSIIWNIREAKIKLSGPRSFNSLMFSPDGASVLSTGRYNKSARVWSANTGKIKFALNGHLSAVNSAFYSSDGTRIVTTSNDDTIRIWDANNGDELLILNAGRCDFAKFFPNGKSIVFHCKFGPNRGINVMKALDFKYDREKYGEFKKNRYSNWLNLNTPNPKRS